MAKRKRTTAESSTQVKPVKESIVRQQPSRKRQKRRERRRLRLHVLVLAQVSKTILLLPPRKAWIATNESSPDHTTAESTTTTLLLPPSKSWTTEDKSATNGRSLKGSAQQHSGPSFEDRKSVESAIRQRSQQRAFKPSESSAHQSCQFRASFSASRAFKASTVPFSHHTTNIASAFDSFSRCLGDNDSDSASSSDDEEDHQPFPSARKVWNSAQHGNHGEANPSFDREIGTRSTRDCDTALDSSSADENGTILGPADPSSHKAVLNHQDLQHQAEIIVQTQSERASQELDDQETKTQAGDTQKTRCVLSSPITHTITDNGPDDETGLRPPTDTHAGDKVTNELNNNNNLDFKADFEDGNIEQELFEDIQHVWEDIASFTLDPSPRIKRLVQPRRVSELNLHKSVASHYGLPIGLDSHPIILCRQAVVDAQEVDLSSPEGPRSAEHDQVPSVTGKRKRRSDVSSRRGRQQEAKQNAIAESIDDSVCVPDIHETDGLEIEDSQESPATTVKRRRVQAGVSTALFPPTAATTFGLLQEKLWREPFWLLIAVTFLNKTAGAAAAPVFWQLKEQYPTPEELADANFDHVRDMIRHLGLQTQRAKRLLKMARAWADSPPKMDCLYRTLHYPQRGEGKEYSSEEVIHVDMPSCAGALEIGHIPGCGPYAWDSWRIFCRDVLRGAADDYNGLNAKPNFQPEWQRVLPLDKELRAYLRWMWLREGFVWDHETGEKRKLTRVEREKASKGEIGPADEDEKKFTAQAHILSPVSIPARRSMRFSSDNV